MSSSKPQEYKTNVREQYEDFPYPFRDIEKEGTFFSSCDPMAMAAYSHAGWGGKRDLRKDGRILIAGCGTGDTAIHYAEEMLGHPGEIVAIDLSSKSIGIAKARLAKRGLSDSVTFHHMSILDAPDAGLGEFDVIESSGVLHHMPDPDAGLAALTKMLKPDGLMAIMVYGQHGRMAVYLVQELMKQLMVEETPREQKIAIAREFLNAIPVGHWMTVNNQLFIEDIRFPDGSGIYDLFLHSTDRAYTVPQLYDWVEGRGLKLLSLFADLADETVYTPESYNPSPILHAIFQQKTPRERHTIAELMNGNLSKHFFYAAKQEKIPAQFADDMVMTYAPLQSLFVDQFIPSFLAALKNAPLGQRVEGQCRPFPEAPLLYVFKTPYVEALMPLIDGNRSIGEIIAKVVADTGANPADVRRDLLALYKEYRARQMVFLRHQSIPRYATGPEIGARVKKVIGK